MDTPLLTITEASEKTGRSSSTIRRLIRTIVDADNHTDRSGIEPTAKAVEAFKKKGDNFAWKIREDVLLKHFTSAPTGERKNSSSSGSALEKDIVDILKTELDLKNEQIEKQWEVISALNERLREGNILMGSLQQRLTLPSPQSAAPVVVEQASTEDSTKAIQRASKKKVMEVKQKASTEASKKSLLHWLFK